MHWIAVALLVIVVSTVAALAIAQIFEHDEDDYPTLDR